MPKKSLLIFECLKVIQEQVLCNEGIVQTLAHVSITKTFLHRADHIKDMEIATTVMRILNFFLNSDVVEFHIYNNVVLYFYLLF